MKYNPREKEFAILEMLYKKDSARYCEIRDYLKEKFGCADSTVKARLEALRKKGYLENIRRGVYKITGKGILEYEEEVRKLKCKESALKGDAENLERVLRDISSLGGYFSYGVVIYGKFNKKIEPKKFFEYIDEEFNEIEDTEGGYQVYYFDTGYSFLLTVYPEYFWFFAPAFDVRSKTKIVDFGADFVWRFLLLGLSYYFYQLGSFTHSRGIQTDISYVLFVDYIRNKIFVDERKMEWVDFLVRNININIKDLREIKRIAKDRLSILYNKFDDKRIRRLWEEFSEKIMKKYKKSKVNISMHFLPRANYLTAVGLVSSEEKLTTPPPYFNIKYEGKEWTIVFDVDRLREMDDVHVLKIFAQSIMRCLYPEKNEEELLEEAKHFLKEEFGVES